GFVEYQMPTSTDIPTAVAVAADGTVWFTIEFSNSIGVLRNGAITKLPKGRQNLEPIGLAVDSHGFAWYTDAPARVIARLSRDGRLTELDVPTRGSAPSDITVDPTGAVWFLEFRGNKIGRYAGGRFTEFPVPTPRAGLTGLAVAPDGAVWFAEIRGHALGR